jgi:homoaconitate hydratase
MSRTAIEKIVGRYVVGSDDGSCPCAGEYVRIRPKHVMTHDNTGAVIPKYEAIVGKDAPVADPRQPVFAMDHDIQNLTPENLGKYARIQAFAGRQGIDYYPPGRGIAHQVMVEEGYVTPGSLIVGSDSHSNLYGAVGAVGTPVVRTDAAAIWATGETWWQVPRQVKVVLEGEVDRARGVSGKDVIITLCGLFCQDEVLNCAVEFHGSGVASLSIEERMTISNMTTEWGALVGMFPFDDVLRQFLLERARHLARRGGTPRYTDADVEAWWASRAEPDADARYDRIVTLDLASVTPHVSGPNSVKTMTALHEIERQSVKIDKAYLMSCVNARLSDFAAAARVFEEAGARVADGVEFYVAAASNEIEAEARSLGYWDRLTDAGVIALPPGCGACIGLGAGTLEPGEVGISATNRNFKGRMGSRDALCYLASPEVVAASAIRGIIAAPMSGAVQQPRGTCSVLETPERRCGTREIVEGFPRRVRGRVLYLPADNLDTDGIYGKDVTYRDDITRGQQGRYAMLNYDRSFHTIAREDDVVVGGRNFGTGSSREQAVTALMSLGIGMVIAASANQTYKRNALNNGFIVLECPDLVDRLAAMLASEVAADVRTIVGPEVEVDFVASVIEFEGVSIGFDGLSPTAQELVAAGGSEAVVKRRRARG